MRRTVTALIALGIGLTVSAGLATASAASPSSVPPRITAAQCLAGGGGVVSLPPRGLYCQGGLYDGSPVFAG